MTFNLAETEALVLPMTVVAVVFAIVVVVVVVIIARYWCSCGTCRYANLFGGEIWVCYAQTGNGV